MVLDEWFGRDVSLDDDERNEADDTEDKHDDDMSGPPLISRGRSDGEGDKE